MVKMRGPTSRAELGITWMYPTFKAEMPEAAPGETVAIMADYALDLDEAFKIVAGEDTRPLLVLRECVTCSGTDDALLTRGADNEKTMLMSRWFHCVKLPPSVLEEDHAFHNMFAGDSPSHLFMSRADGSGRMNLDGEQSRTELWSKMEKLLAAEYKTKHKPVLKKILGVLDELDELDTKIAETDGRMNDAIEHKGPKSSLVKKLKSQLTKLGVEREELRAKVNKLATLTMKKSPEHASASNASDDAA